MKIKYSILILFLVSLSACSSIKIDNLNAYKSVSLKEAAIFPTQEQLQGKKETLVIQNINNNSELAKKSAAGEAVSSQLYKFLAETNVEIINREAAKKFQKEIALALESGGEYEGPKVANYVLDGQVDHVSFNVSYGNTTAGSALNLLAVVNETEYKVEKRCIYTGAIQGNLKLYKLPENQLIKTITINDSEEYSKTPSIQRTNATSELISSLFSQILPNQCPANQSLVSQLINNAAKESVRKTRLFLLNFFASKGYVSEMLEYDGSYLIKTTAGSKQGLVTGQKAEIFTLLEKTNKLTGKINQEERVVATGIVSDKIGADYSYIILEEAEKSSKIRLGDFIKIKHEKQFLEKVTDFDF